ncbi:MAG: hypothetical protein PX637_20290, partial [Microcystis sp. M53601_WE4]|nr:hypothetical protein [Microcystis sp. M53601_WE4]
CLLDILVQTPHQSQSDRYLRKLLIENLGLKPRRRTTGFQTQIFDEQFSQIAIALRSVRGLY